MSKNLDIKWYSLDNILKYDVQYYMIFGERSNGKSYAVDKYIIDKFFLEGEQFAFVKRFEDDIKSKYMSEVFTPLEPYILEKYGYRIKFYRGCWLVYEDGTEGKLSECKTFGYAFSLNNVNRTKATSYPNVTTILFVFWLLSKTFTFSLRSIANLVVKPFLSLYSRVIISPFLSLCNFTFNALE